MAIMNKRAGFMDLPVAMIAGFILIVCIVIMTYAVTTIKDKLIEVAPTIQPSFTEANVTTIINNSIGKVVDAYSTLKWISVMLILGYFLSILISAFLVKSHPAWFVGYFLMVIVTIILSVPISNNYETLYQDTLLANTWINFTGANFIFLNLPVWIAVIGLLAGLLMYINLDWGTGL